MFLIGIKNKDNMKALYLVMLLATCNCFGQSFKRISRAILSSSIQEPIQFSKLGHEIRMQLYKNGKLDFVNRTHDTLWMLESQFMDTGVRFGRIWSSKGDIVYTFNRGKLNTDSSRLFTRHICHLIEKWDTLTIKAEEKEQKSLMDGKYIYGTRVILSGRNIEINKISFNELFKWDRDIND